VIAYFDTSALVKRYMQEADSDRVLALWSAVRTRAVSRLAFAETLSAFRRKQRERPEAHAVVETSLEEFMRDWQTFLIVEVTADLDDPIRRLLADHTLKGADTIHLASCLVLAERLAQSPVFACWDEALLQAARAEGLSTIPEERSGC
jgi:predicted nucleic acid-binding protein